MKPIAVLTDAQLTFHIQDAESAISANPHNPKTPQYWDEMEACQRELLRRASVRRLRVYRLDLPDPLAAPLRARQWIYARLPRMRTDAREAARAAAYFTHCRPR